MVPGPPRVGETGKEEVRLKRALHPWPESAMLPPDCETKSGPSLDNANKITQSRKPGPAHRRRGGHGLCPGLWLLGFLGGMTGARAQGVLTPPSQIYERP